MNGWRKSTRSCNGGNCVEVASGYRKSSRSESGNCVEVASGYRTSSRCQAGECVEVGAGTAMIAVRDTADRTGPVLTFPAAAWAAFTARTAEPGN